MPRILIVDDEKDVRDVLRRFFAKKSYDVLTAEDGNEALTVIEQEKEKIDAVLLDIVMPGLNGVEVLRKMLAMKPGLPIIMVSGETDEEQAKTTLQEGAFDYVLKPFDLDYLERTLYMKLAAKLF